jgi:PAS domain-containing protein
MDTDLQHTLLQLFQQVSDNPDDIPVVPVEKWREGSVERQLLTGFRHVLERIQQSRQQAEEQLREKEAQYRSIFEVSSDALLIVDLEDGGVVEVNPAACPLGGS